MPNSRFLQGLQFQMQMKNGSECAGIVSLCLHYWNCFSLSTVCLATSSVSTQIPHVTELLNVIPRTSQLGMAHGTGFLHSAPVNSALLFAAAIRNLFTSAVTVIGSSVTVTCNGLFTSRIYST